MAIVVTELPYQVNKASLVEKIADLVQRQEDRGHRRPPRRVRPRRHAPGHRVQARRDPRKVLNNLFKHTPLQLAFNINMLALVDGQPQTLPLKAVLQHHIDWRREVVRRRTEFDLGKARDRAHILEGLKIALDNLDAVIATIRESADVDTRAQQPDRAASSSVGDPGQRDPRDAAAPPGGARAQEDRGRVPGHHPAHRRAGGHPRQPGARAGDHQGRAERAGAQVRRRRDGPASQDDSNRELTDEDLIADEDVVVTVSGRGYIKRQPLATYRRQARGGKGIIGARTVEEDAVAPPAGRQHPRLGAVLHQPRAACSAPRSTHPGRQPRRPRACPIINLEGVQVEAGERVLAVITIPNFEKGDNLVMATRQGIIKKTPIEQFERVRSTGIRAITVAEDDELAWVGVSSGNDDIVLATALGQIARFNETEVRPMGRDAAGVIGIRLASKGDQVVGMGIVEPDDDMLVLTETGYGKRVAARRLPAQAPRRPGRPAHRARGRQDRQRRGRRAGRRRTDEELLLISASGQVVRTDVEERQPLRAAPRAASS